MGYDFAVDGDLSIDLRLDNWQMEQLRLVMLEAGAVTGADRLFGNEQFAPSPAAVPLEHFTAHDGRQVTADQATLIAARLRAALTADLIGDMALLHYDQPTQLRDWVEQFATFNEQAATHGGYRIG